jgi:hypothetical protein
MGLMPRRIVFVLVVVACMSLGWFVAGASAEACPNEQLRQEDNALNLPDCRSYELVSPAEKNASDVIGGDQATHASSEGDAVGFSSSGAFGQVQNSYGTVSYLARRASAGWSTSGLTSPQDQDYTLSGDGPAVFGFTSDLSHAIVRRKGLTASDGTAPLDLYDLDTTSGSLQRLSPTSASSALSPYEFRFAGVSDDQRHILFESTAALTPDATVNGSLSGANTNLYENVDGQTRLVDILPNGTPAPDGGTTGATLSGYTIPTHAMSTDGSRIVWQDESDGEFYMRIGGVSTIAISVSQRTIPSPPNPNVVQQFLGSTPTGSTVFFSSDAELTNDASTTPGQPDLYAFDTESRSLTDLSEATAGAGVLGLLGYSDDGSYVYFAATAALGGEAVVGQANVYVWHEGTLTYIATLDASANPIEQANYEPTPTTNDLPKDSRVTPDGLHLVFSSTHSLTGYDNASFSEIYRYDFGSELTCISCNPSGVPATGDALFGQRLPGFVSVVATPFLPAVMTPDAGKIFFNTPDALVPDDSNGREDVYEWDAGRVSLISSGTASGDSVFADASASGNDVFFVTRQRLVGQDIDSNTDLYDARVDGGFPAPAQEVQCSGDQCQSQPSSSPVFGMPASVTFGGSGNLTHPRAEPAKPQAKKKLSRAKNEKLAKAVNACRVKKSRRRRSACEVAARKRYGSSTKVKPRKSKRNSRGGK